MDTYHFVRYLDSFGIERIASIARDENRSVLGGTHSWGIYHEVQISQEEFENDSLEELSNRYPVSSS